MKNSEFCEQIYQQVRALGLVDNQWDFSVLCGRTPAWFSGIKARGLPMTTDAMLTLSHNVQSQANEVADEPLCKRVNQLSCQLISEAQAQIARKQQLLSEYRQ